MMHIGLILYFISEKLYFLSLKKYFRSISLLFDCNAQEHWERLEKLGTFLL